jgi:Ribosome-assembly protein 3
MSSEKLRQYRNGGGAGKRARSDDENATKATPFKHQKVAGASALPSLAATALPSPSEVRALPLAAQTEFINRAAQLCEKAVHTVDDGVAALNAGSGISPIAAAGNSVEDAVLADMVRLRGVPMAREFVEMTLWRRLRNANTKVLAAVDAISGGDEGPIAAVGDGARTIKASASFKQMYMQDITKRYAKDLEALRASEDLDGERVQFLMQCLQSGADLFAGLGK